MKKQLVGILSGALVGVIDLIPMVMQNLTWDANLSAFVMWLVVGFLSVNFKLRLPGILKSLLLAFLVLLPSAILIGWHNPLSLIPIVIMTILLGSLLGILINFFSQKI